MQEPQDDQPIIIEPMQPADAAVIWLHGLGADGNDFVGIVPELQLPIDHGVRFIFPHAKHQDVTINGGMRMRAWYDIRSLDFMGDVDAAGIRVACYQVYDLIRQQIAAGIPADRIVLAGFSQGGLIALHAALSYEQELAGILAMSTYCPMYEQFYMHRQMPIMMVHGLNDQVIPLTVAEHSKLALERKGYHIEWHTYLMQHQVCGEEIADIAAWLKRVLKLKE